MLSAVRLLKRLWRGKKHFWVIYVACGAISVRGPVRVIEFAQGPTGFVASHEAFMYVFDAAPIFFVVSIYASVHPGGLINAMRPLKTAG